MFPFLLEGCLSLAVELGLALVQLALEAGIDAYKRVFGRPNRQRIDACLAYFVFGGWVGLLLAFVVPEPLWPRASARGMSLVVSPLALGALMSAWGRYRRSKGHSPSNLATFHGGAAFALGTALVRFYFVSL